MHVREYAATALHPVAIVDGLLEQLERTRSDSEEGAARP